MLYIKNRGAKTVIRTNALIRTLEVVSLAKVKQFGKHVRRYRIKTHGDNNAKLRERTICEGVNRT